MDYSRKVSKEEADMNRILILKNLVKKFPPVGSAVICRFDGKNVHAHIIEEPCTCVGPDKPHVLWYISFEQKAGLTPGVKTDFQVTSVE
jgi:hypothetical protein